MEFQLLLHMGVTEMGGLLSRVYKIYPPEIAAIALAKEQHAPGVTVRMNENFQVEYVRPDGSIVPGYEHFLKLAHEGKL